MNKKTTNKIDFFCQMLKIAFENQGYTSISAVKKIITFMRAAVQNKQHVEFFLNQSKNFKFESIASEKLGVLIWPYIHNNWEVAKRLKCISTHHDYLYRHAPNLIPQQSNLRLKVIDFNHLSEKVRLTIDQAHWFRREGELVINVFKADLRVASIAFAISQADNLPVAYVGAIQGIHQGVPADESLEIYRELTKAFEGLRPKSLLLEVLKVVLAQLGIKKIYAVSEKNRHHRHTYFGANQDTKFKTDYNTFWLEHGGVLDNDTGFYELPMALAIKDLSEIASNKRSMYRRRYAILRSLNDNITIKQTSFATTQQA